MISDVCDTLYADKHKVLEAVGNDSRIGNKYFKPGYSFGGPCFPRDTKALKLFIDQAGINSGIMRSTTEYNEEHTRFQTDQLLRQGREEYVIENVCYKANSSVPIIEESAKLKIAKKLVDSKTYGQRTIKETVSMFRPRPEDDTKGDPGWASYSDEQLRKSISLIKKLIKTLGKFMNGLSEVTVLEGRTTVEDISEDTLKSFNRSINYLSDCLRKVSAKIARKEGK